MNATASRQLKLKNNSASHHKRKRKQGVDSLDGERQKSANNCMFDKLHYEIVAAILSCMRVEDAVRTSVLSSRWRYMWTYMDTYNSKALKFDYMDTDTGTRMKWKKFKNLVNHVLTLHRAPLVDSLIIRFGKLRARSRSIDNWIFFAMNKQVETFELNLSNHDLAHCGYKFPKIEKLFSRLHEVIQSPFRCLRCLRLVDVDIEDDVVRYFLASCPYIVELCITASSTTENLIVVDQLGYLKVLQISHCRNLQSMQISATNLVSCRYHGMDISLPFKKTPNLFELDLGWGFCESFIYEPNKHLSYSVQLVKLVLNIQAELSFVGERIIAPPDLPRLYALKRLELSVESQVGESLLFFISLIKASPCLQEFKIKIDYLVAVPGYTDSEIRNMLSFPEVSSLEASGFDHKNLKMVEMAGYCGCENEGNFLVQLSKIAPSLEMFVIDTKCDYYRDLVYGFVVYRLSGEGEKPMKKKQKKKMTKTRFNAKKAKKRAEKFASTFPSQAKFVIT